MRKAVTLLGRGPSWRHCQWNTDDLWAVASCLVTPGLEDKPYTKVFAFDTPDDELGRAIQIAQQRQIPIVSRLSYATEPFPLWDIVGTFKTSYFMPTMSYMLAYAIFLGFSIIYVHGIDQGPQWQYQFGRPHISFWLGFAAAKGIELRIGRDSLRWAYWAGLDTFPRAFMEAEKEQIALHVGDLCVAGKR